MDGALHLPTTDQVFGSLEQGKLPPLPLPLIDSMNQQRAGQARGGEPR